MISEISPAAVVFGPLMIVFVILAIILSILLFFLPYFVYRIYLHTLETNQKMDMVIYELKANGDSATKTNKILKQLTGQDARPSP